MRLYGGLREGVGGLREGGKGGGGGGEGGVYCSVRVLDREKCVQKWRSRFVDFLLIFFFLI